MLLLTLTVLGAGAMVIGYTFGLAGPVVATIFFTFPFTGGLIRAAQPIIDWLTRP
jgi:hypothetical protein